MQVTIPEQDLKAINVALSPKKGLAVYKGKNEAANKGAAPDDGIIRPRGFEVKNYNGKKLKHRKSYIGPDSVQVVVCEAGDLYDNIPLAKRDRVQFSDDDFE